MKILDVDIKVKTEKFDYQHLKNIHQYIFGDIYSWAGKERIISVVKGERVLGGDTVRYSYPDNIEKDAKIIINQLNNITWKELGIEETAEKFAKLIAALCRFILLGKEIQGQLLYLPCSILNILVLK